jgi:hypothetical protein
MNEHGMVDVDVQLEIGDLIAELDGMMAKKEDHKLRTKKSTEPVRWIMPNSSLIQSNQPKCIPCITIAHKERFNIIPPVQRFVIHELNVVQQQLADIEAEFDEFKHMKPLSIEPFHGDVTISQSFWHFQSDVSPNFSQIVPIAWTFGSVGIRSPNRAIVLEP